MKSFETELDIDTNPALLDGLDGSIRALQEAKQRARQAVDYLTRLQHVTTALSAALTMHEVADVIIEHGLTTLDANTGVISLLSEDGAEFVNIRIVGYPPQVAETWSRFAADQEMAIPDAVRLGELVILESWDERVARYPNFTHVRAPGSDGALAAVPLIVKERAIGALGLGFPAARTFTAEERAFMQNIGQQCALALDRARLFDAERSAHRQAQEQIAQRKQAEEALAANEARFRSLIENALDIISIINIDGTIRYESPAIQEVLGYAPEELTGKLAFEYVHPDDLAVLVEAFARILEHPDTVVAVEYRFRHKDGSWKMLESRGRNALADPAVAGVIINSTDITERHETEEALSASYRQTEEILESITDAFYAVDSDFRFTYVNRKAEQLWGKSYRELIGKHCWTVFPSAVGSATYHAQLNAAADRQAQNFDTLSPIIGKWVEVNIYPTNDGGLAVYFRDISERKATEDALRQGEERYRSLVVTTAQIVWTADARGEFAGITSSWGDFTGQSPAEYLGLGWAQAIHPDDRERSMEAWKKALNDRTPYACEYRIQHRDGFYRNTVARAVPLFDAEGAVREWIGTNTDITERVKHLGEIENLNVRLKRSIQETHHRVKNNLQIISALTELQIEEGAQTVPTSAVIRIGQHTRSLAAIHDLLTQQAKADTQIETISTAAAMDRLIPLLEATTGGRPIRYRVDDVQLPVQEGTSLALLVSELISNAVKHGKGEIEVTFEVRDGRAHLEVCDDGPGFPDNFDPRFAANTGLSLIDSTGRFELRGTIEYRNRANGGARVAITFPLEPSHNAAELEA